MRGWSLGGDKGRCEHVPAGLAAASSTRQLELSAMSWLSEPAAAIFICQHCHVVAVWTSICHLYLSALPRRGCLNQHLSSLSVSTAMSWLSEPASVIFICQHCHVVAVWTSICHLYLSALPCLGCLNQHLSSLSVSTAMSWLSEPASVIFICQHCHVLAVWTSICHLYLSALPRRGCLNQHLSSLSVSTAMSWLSEPASVIFICQHCHVLAVWTSICHLHLSALPRRGCLNQHLSSLSVSTATSWLSEPASVIFICQHCHVVAVWTSICHLYLSALPCLGCLNQHLSSSSVRDAVRVCMCIIMLAHTHVRYWHFNWVNTIAVIIILFCCRRRSTKWCVCVRACVHPQYIS